MLCDKNIDSVEKQILSFSHNIAELNKKDVVVIILYTYLKESYNYTDNINVGMLFSLHTTTYISIYLFLFSFGAYGIRETLRFTSVSWS
jgi:hypothetical protein